jgi:tRNA 5-methylaminomethyl-2-thiouridine biosynthesis bifunctional protein
MPSPRPLTQTPAADLDWSDDATPSATHFGDIYFSIDGGLDETRAVFLGGCGLPEAWENQRLFTIAELGFGSGLNFLATWQMWNRTRSGSQRLHFVSIEKFPFDKVQLTRALAAWPELAEYSQRLIESWPGRVCGIHRMEFDAITLTLIHDDVINAFDQIDGLQANAWFLDGFSPSGNPMMWSAEAMSAIAKHSAPHARLATFSVAGAVRRALTDAGFNVKKMPGFGRKRHRLEAELGPELSNTVSSKPLPIKHALIVGAGIAGRSLARALKVRDISFDIIDDRKHPAASGNPLALVKPRFDLQDRPESRFFLAAYLHALRAYPESAVIDRGIRQLPKTEKDTARFEKLIAQAALGESHLSLSGDTLEIHSALVIDPYRIFDDVDIRVESYEEAHAKANYSHIFLAAGYGLSKIAPNLHLRMSRGQLTWSEPVADLPLAYGGYVANIEGAALVGATHDRLDDTDPFALRPGDDTQNLEALSDVLNCTVTPIDRPSRASVRVTSRDTLPILADLSADTEQVVWAMTGLGSRGFTFAPLLAEALVADICGEVGPLDRHVRTLFGAQTRYI